MPELPEVEVIRRGLLQFVGDTPSDIWRSNKPLRFDVDGDLLMSLVGSKLHAIDRRGKYLAWHFQKNSTDADGVSPPSHPVSHLVSHLGMSGKFRQEQQSLKQDAKHDHLVLSWESGRRLIYNDVRRFGGFFFYQGSDSDKVFDDLSLGADALDEGFVAKRLLALAASSKRNVREWLLDQRKIAGIGNIYVSEILWHSAISPDRLVCDLSIKDARAIISATRKVLRKAIRAGGSTIRDFASSDDASGYFQLQLMAYGRKDEPCLRPSCRGTIVMEQRGGRASFACNMHQRH